VSESCEMCGRTPAAVVTVRRHVGMLFVSRRHRLTAPLCREHGELLVRDWTRKTLVQGWWSYRSWILNIHALIGNHRARRALARLPHPYAVPEGRFDDEPFPEHLGWGLAAFQPKPAFDTAPDLRPTFASRPTFGERRDFRTEEHPSKD
jgi:hypothetical protein